MTIEGKRQSIPLTEGPIEPRPAPICVVQDSRRTIFISQSSESRTPGPRLAPATCICAMWRRRSRKAFARPAAPDGVQHGHHLRRITMARKE